MLAGVGTTNAEQYDHGKVVSRTGNFISASQKTIKMVREALWLGMHHDHEVKVRSMMIPRRRTCNMMMGEGVSRSNQRSFRY